MFLTCSRICLELETDARLLYLSRQFFPTLFYPGAEGNKPEDNATTEPRKVAKFDRILCDVPCSGDGLFSFNPIAHVFHITIVLCFMRVGTFRKNPNLWSTWDPHFGDADAQTHTRAHTQQQTPRKNHKNWGMPSGDRRIAWVLGIGLHPMQLAIAIRGAHELSGFLISLGANSNLVHNPYVSRAGLQMLKVGGLMVYSTWSLNPIEVLFCFYPLFDMCATQTTTATINMPLLLTYACVTLAERVHRCPPASR